MTKKQTLIVLLILSVALLFGGFTLTACTPSVGNPMADAANNLINTKADAITVFQGIDLGCKQGMIPAADCLKASNLYKKVPSTYQAANDALVLAEQTGNMTQADASAKTLTDLLTDLQAIKGATTK